LQLLQRIKNGTPITQSELANLEKTISGKMEEGTKDFLRETFFKTLYIGYFGSGFAKSAAGILYWPLRQLSNKDVRLTPGEEILYHTLPYHDEDSLVILFAEPGTENLVAKTSDAVRLTGSRMLVIAPPLPDIILSRITGPSITIDYQDLPLAFIIAAAKLATILSKSIGEIKIRTERVVNEYSEISIIYNDLIDRYRNNIANISDTIVQLKKVIIYTSPTLEPASNLLHWYLNTVAIESKLATISTLLSDISTSANYLFADTLSLIVSTDVEADILREAKFKASLANIRSYLSELVIHTDPLTAPLYASLISNRIYTTVVEKMIKNA
jgi:hypothetical protein